MIPKVIVQTSKEKPKSYVINLILSHCKGYDYIWFSDDQIISFLKNNPIDEFPDIIKVFQSFSNGAHKADLFRYYYLYINGGIYLDSDAILETSVNEIIKNYKFVSIKSYHKNQDLLFNGFIACEPKHEILYKALKDIYMIKDQDLKNDYLLVCKNLYHIYLNSFLNDMRIYQEKKLKRFRAGVVSFDGKKRILTHYCYLKKIPKYNSKLSFLIISVCFKFRLLYKMYKFFS